MYLPFVDYKIVFHYFLGLNICFSLTGYKSQFCIWGHWGSGKFINSLIHGGISGRFAIRNKVSWPTAVFHLVIFCKSCRLDKIMYKYEAQWWKYTKIKINSKLIFFGKFGLSLLLVKYWIHSMGELAISTFLSYFLFFAEKVEPI